MLIAQFRPVFTGLLLVGCIISNVHANNDQVVAANAEPSLVEGDILVSGPITLRGVERSTGSRWRNGVIPYQIDPNLAAYSVAFIEEAIDAWNNASSISLVPMERAANEFKQDYIYFKPGAGCASWVGKQGGRQDIWVAPNCTAGSMMHEIGHAIGLEHEHTRPDRDQYIQINWENIKPEKVQNFDASSDALRMVGAYDYESIMHYGSQFFSSNGRETIVPIFSDKAVIGQRDAPSRGDIETIAAMYASEHTLRVLTHSSSDSSNVSVFVKNHVQLDAHDISVAMQVGSAIMKPHVGDQWNCAQSGSKVSCTLAHLHGYDESQLQLQFEGKIDESALAVHFVAAKASVNQASNKDDIDAQTSTEMPVTLFSDQGSSVNAGANSYSLLLLLLYWVVQLQRTRANHARSRRH